MRDLARAIEHLAAAFDRQTDAMVQLARVDAESVATARERLHLEQAEYAAARAANEEE